VKNNLKMVRGDKSRKEVATAIGITEAHIGYIERGERIPSLDVAIKIADYFDKKIEEIFIPE